MKAGRREVQNEFIGVSFPPSRLHVARTLIARAPWWVVAWCVAGSAAAQAPALEVVREPGAERCPDAAALLARVEQLRQRPDSGEAARYRVRFARAEQGFVASVAPRADPARARVLRDRGQTCIALERAAAVTLSLLLDSDARDGTHPPRAATTALLASPAVTSQPSGVLARPAGTAVVADRHGESERESERASEPAHSPPRVQLAIGAGALAGVLRPFAPALHAELGLAAGRMRAGLAGLFAPEQGHALGPGEVRERLIAGAARGCFAPWLDAALRLDACTGLYAGALHARADGFSRDQSASRLWLALPIGLTLSSTSLPFGWELDAALLWPLRRDDFAVEPLGTAYASPKLAGLLTVRGYAAWEW